ncbi:glycosyl hydrolase family 18 protein [Verrucomicrobiaceae bacterium 227]
MMFLRISNPFRIVFIFFTGIFCLLGSSSAQERKREGRVMTWVPPYAVDACRERLDQSFDGVGMKDGLTHLGLQFWQPTREGNLKLVEGFQVIDETTILKFKKWGDSHGIQTMLCVYNGTSAGWDWELAKAAFDTHRKRFVDALVSETLRLKLDGVDIDLEGKGKLEGDRKSYVRFIKELSARLHAIGKELTIDTFAYQWHAPNQAWWAELLPHLDGLHVMGYAETGAGAADWRSYGFIKAAAGEHASKLLLGVPGKAATWQNKPASEHLAWIQNDGSLGLAIWDARLSSPAWRSKGMWQMIAKIKGIAEVRK